VGYALLFHPSNPGSTPAWANSQKRAFDGQFCKLLKKLGKSKIPMFDKIPKSLFLLTNQSPAADLDLLFYYIDINHDDSGNPLAAIGFLYQPHN